MGNVFIQRRIQGPKNDKVGLDNNIHQVLECLLSIAGPSWTVSILEPLIAQLRLGATGEIGSFVQSGIWHVSIGVGRR